MRRELQKNWIKNRDKNRGIISTNLEEIASEIYRQITGAITVRKYQFRPITKKTFKASKNITILTITFNVSFISIIL
jgi:hypothetical protein